MSDHSHKDVLIVFAKLPEPGKVKTRLAKDLGDQKAAEIYSVIARDIISRVSSSEKYTTAIFYDPPDKKNEIISWLEDIAPVESHNYFEQEGNILGERISYAFEKVFSGGADRAVIIGTDCSEVSAEMIEDTFEELRGYDTVIGPAQDGGYYLLGLSRYDPLIFQDIEWSTERVFEQTLRRVQEQGLNCKILKTLSDIDNIEDLKRTSYKFNYG